MPKCAYRLLLVSSVSSMMCFQMSDRKFALIETHFWSQMRFVLCVVVLSMFFQMSDRNFVVLPGSSVLSSLHTFYAMLADFASQTHDVCLLCAQIFSCHALL